MGSRRDKQNRMYRALLVRTWGDCLWSVWPYCGSILGGRVQMGSLCAGMGPWSSWAIDLGVSELPLAAGNFPVALAVD